MRNSFEKLTKMVSKDAQTGCWNWAGGLNSYGYGKVMFEAKGDLAHRVFYRNLVGAIPGGLQIDHLCKNRRCCNPQHMEVVTLVENVRRGECPTAVNARKTHCLRGHEFSPENTFLKNGRRVCKTCRRAADNQEASKARRREYKRAIRREKAEKEASESVRAISRKAA